MFKYLLIVSICLLIILTATVPCSAKVYVIVNDATGEITSVSPEDDAVQEAGHSKIVLNKDYDTVILNHDPQYYRYINGKFVENIQKISDEENVRIAAQEKLAEMALIRKRAFKIAFDQLVSESVVFNYVSQTDFE